MKTILILTLGIIILTSCKEQVTETLIDASKMSHQTKYFYNYESDKLISQTEKTYTIMFGQVVDSMLIETVFGYNNKGLLIKKKSQNNFEQKAELRMYDYDSNDSLILDMTINPENDTTFWNEYKYFSDGRKIVFDRKIIPSYFNNSALIENLASDTFDTIQYQYKYQYEGNICTHLKQYDSKNNLAKTIKFDYQNDLLIKETHLSYFNSLELLEKIKNYDYSKSEHKPDTYALDSENDTIEMSINEFYKDELLSTTDFFEYGNLIYKTLFESGKEISIIGFDRTTNNRSVDILDYYKNGDLKESKSYNEEINAL
ncbi:hypothetical protein [Labilibaculum antarcticum]|uniref:Uncharacterized protein n=1 Tax=Labilibaculum antarcticum TaxID=1717717 RepID=A0A1Y1CN81_9BACT|nr:hypothetical protein [Labilibaculum antarcticum]BAX81473.1 hypothetical protein ALGA_3173 [Labilibaculum antarcticum]